MAVPVEFIPIGQTFCVRLEFFFRGVVMQFHISREPHICGRHATSKRTAVQGGGPVLLCVTGGLMRDLVGQGLSEELMVPGILQRQSCELVIDVNALITDTHS